MNAVFTLQMCLWVHRALIVKSCDTNFSANINCITMKFLRHLYGYRTIRKWSLIFWIKSGDINYKSVPFYGIYMLRERSVPALVFWGNNVFSTLLCERQCNNYVSLLYWISLHPKKEHFVYFSRQIIKQQQKNMCVFFCVRSEGLHNNQ